MLKAFAALSLLCSSAPAADSSVPLREALAQFNRGKYLESFDLAAQYAREYPDSAAALKIRGMSEYMLGRPHEALGSVTRATEADPHDAEAFYYLGRLYFSEDNAASALTAFQHAITLDPSSARAHNSLGQTYEALGRRREAENAYKAAIDIQNKGGKASEWPDYNLGKFYLDDGMTDDAVASFRRALRINPASPDAKIKLAVALSKKEPVPESFALLLEALRGNPGNPEAHYSLALLLTRAGKPDEAREHFLLFEKYRNK